MRYPVFPCLREICCKRQTNRKPDGEVQKQRETETDSENGIQKRDVMACDGSKRLYGTYSR